MSALPPSLEAVQRRIDADKGLRALYEAIANETEDDAHGLAHVLRVARWTVAIGHEDTTERECLAAALLHDLVNVPKSSPDRARASELSADAARPLLHRAGFDNDAVDRIADAIRDHSFSRGATPTTPLGMALQDADRLEALGAIGIARTFATGQRMGANLFDAIDPFAKHRELDDRANSVDHFSTKLLGLAETMLTDAGRVEAMRRTEILEQFLEALRGELR
ncbi:MAG: hypothetical protein ACI81R_003323 [Bradymonadia bacterium]|jgi:uncharacterized protein